MKMTSREQQQRSWEMEFSLSHTNPLFNQPPSPQPSPSSSLMMELECSKTVMDNTEEEHRDLSPKISKAELLRIKRLLENRLQASPGTEEKATKALSHLKSAPFTSPSPQSAGGKRRRSTGHIAGELLRTHGCLGRNKSTDTRPYDPKQNFLSPRPQFLRNRPNRRLDLLQRSADSEAYAALKTGDLNQAVNEGIAAEVVKVENLEDNGVVPESCNSSFIVVGASNHIEVGIENISAEEDRHIQEPANIPQSEGLGNRTPGATEAIVKNATPQSWELANRAPGGTQAVNENATPSFGELGNRVPGTTEAISENVTKENNTNIQEAILPQSEELGNGVPGTMEAISENVTKEDNTGSHEPTLQQSEVKDEADTACPKGLLLPPDVKTNVEAIKEYLEENETNFEDPVGAPTMEVTNRNTVTNLSMQKAKLKMVVRFLAVIFLLAMCMVGVTFLAWSSSSDPARTNCTNFFVQPWQNLSASKPSIDFLDVNLLPGTEDKESFEVKDGKLGNLEVLTGVSSQLLVDDYKLYGSSLPDSFAPNVISERSEAAFVEPLPLCPTSLSAMEATGCLQQGQGGMDELVDLVDLAKPPTEENMMKDEAAPDIISNDIEYDIDVGLSTEPEDGNQEDTECAMPVGGQVTWIGLHVDGRVWLNGTGIVLIVLCSEMQLCNALLRWYENKTEELRLAELTKHLRESYTSIFKKVNHPSHALFCCF
ncbi:unnamed protein product [Sphagnum jensenii]|uniref:Uncharacterized protein n=1 Tax=Sphagnum jensenii TaxID=128206 RepID=A0ABP0VGU7_9BRYO